MDAFTTCLHLQSRRRRRTSLWRCLRCLQGGQGGEFHFRLTFSELIGSVRTRHMGRVWQCLVWPLDPFFDPWKVRFLLWFPLDMGEISPTNPGEFCSHVEVFVVEQKTSQLLGFFPWCSHGFHFLSKNPKAEPHAFFKEPCLPNKAKFPSQSASKQSHCKLVNSTVSNSVPDSL